MVPLTTHSLQAMLDQLLTSEHCGIFAKDRNAKFIGANRFLAQTAGFSQSADMLGKSDDDMPWADDFDPDTEQEVMCSGKIAHHTQRVQGKSTTFFAHSIKLPIYEKDTIVGLVGVLIPFDEVKPTPPVMTVALSYCPRVLVVEDSLLMHQVIKSLLTELSCMVTMVKSGEEVAAKVQTNHFDIVLMDMGLPDRQGYEAAKTIRVMGEEGHAPHVIGLTAHVSEDILAQCEAVGIKEVLAKPLMRDKMMGVLSRYVYGRTYYDEASREALRQKRDILYADPEILDLVTTCVKLGSQYLMNEYFRMLSTYLPEWLIVVRDLCDKRRLGDLPKTLHQGKGALSFITAPKLQRALDALNVRSRGRSQTSIDVLYTTLSDEVDALVALFHRLLSRQE